MVFNFQGSQLKFLLPTYRNFPCFLSGSLYKTMHTNACCQCIFQALCLYLLRFLDFFFLCLSIREKETHLTHNPFCDPKPPEYLIRSISYEICTFFAMLKPLNLNRFSWTVLLKDTKLIKLLAAYFYKKVLNFPLLVLQMIYP